MCFFKYKILIVFYVVNETTWLGSSFFYPPYLCYYRQLTNIDCKDLFFFSFLRKIHTNFYVEIWVQLFRLWASKRNGSTWFFCWNFQDITLWVVPDGCKKNWEDKMEYESFTSPKKQTCSCNNLFLTQYYNGKERKDLHFRYTTYITRTSRVWQAIWGAYIFSTSYSQKMA